MEGEIVLTRDKYFNATHSEADFNLLVSAMSISVTTKKLLTTREPITVEWNEQVITTIHEEVLSLTYFLKKKDVVRIKITIRDNRSNDLIDIITFDNSVYGDNFRKPCVLTRVALLGVSLCLLGSVLLPTIFN